MIGGGHKLGGGKFKAEDHPREHGKFAYNGGPHKDKAGKAERARGHAEKATAKLGDIEKRKATAEAKHKAAIAETKVAIKEAKAARAKAEKSPTDENVAAWHAAVSRAQKARAAVDTHAASVEKHSALHAKAQTTHALAQAKLKEAERQAPKESPRSRALHGIGFERMGVGGHEATDVASVHAPVATRHGVSQEAVAHRAEWQKHEIDAEIHARNQAAAEHAATRDLFERASSRGTTSLYQPMSHAQREQEYQNRVRQGARKTPEMSHEQRQMKEQWDRDEHQASVRKMHERAQAERDRYVLPPGSVPFPTPRHSQPAELPRATALPKAARTVGFGLPQAAALVGLTLPTKKDKGRKDELRADARALVDVAAEYPSADSIYRARAAVALARALDE